MTRKFLTSLLAASLLSGCASNALRPASTSVEPVPATEREATVARLVRGNCSQTTRLDMAGGALVGVIAGVAVDFAVSALTAALRRNRDGRNASWVATGVTGDLRPQQAGQSAQDEFCLTVIRGLLRMGDRPSASFADEPVFTLRVNLVLQSTNGERGAPALARGRAGAAAAEPAPSSTVSLIATPYELRYADTSAPVRGSGRKNVSVIIALSPQTLQPASGAAGAPDTSKATVLRFDFGRLQVGRIYGRPLLEPISAVTSFPLTSTPSMITAVVTESEDPNIALNAIIAAVESNSDDLSAALKATIENAVGNNSNDD